MSSPPQSLPGSIDKAVTYLERSLPSLTNPYAVAMTSYALANEKKLNREILYKFAHPGLAESFPRDGLKVTFVVQAKNKAVFALAQISPTGQYQRAACTSWRPQLTPCWHW